MYLRHMQGPLHFLVLLTVHLCGIAQIGQARLQHDMGVTNIRVINSNIIIDKEDKEANNVRMHRHKQKTDIGVLSSNINNHTEDNQDKYVEMHLHKQENYNDHVDAYGRKHGLPINEFAWYEVMSPGAVYNQ
ncbi:uncharacterized protein LOC125945429 [Dermacentor silvarum]|uniref:uncharacterized protein LOC125945429 n=1 Tax=Dermacentor silvarum TaxID=543639 RepID=UPI002101AF13|nr:uncharacterized protein LOC125945429 [Dermacentor silvarum]